MFTPRTENGLLEALCGLVFEKMAWRDDSVGKKCKGQERKAIQIKDAKPPGGTASSAFTWKGLEWDLAYAPSDYGSKSLLSETWLWHLFGNMHAKRRAKWMNNCGREKPEGKQGRRRRRKEEFEALLNRYLVSANGEWLHIQGVYEWRWINSVQTKL